MVSTEQRNEAQQIFMNFQKTKTPFELCTNIIKVSGLPYLHFQAASTLKIAVIRDWKYLETDNRKIHLLNYLLGIFALTLICII